MTHKHAVLFWLQYSARRKEFRYIYNAIYNVSGK